MRTISLNLHYYVLMKTLRDRGQITTLAKQAFGTDYQRMVEAYNDAIAKRDRGYLIVGNFPVLQEDERLVTDIFPGENCILYLPL